jgi:dihydroorotate dehydrogenase
MPDPYHLIRPLLFKLDPERAHELTLKTMQSGLMPFPGPAVRNQALEVTLWGLKFPNPVGLAAGFDKNAEVIGPAFKLGFGFVEVGGVTPEPQAGLPRPRIFRCPEHEAIINRMNFPNCGVRKFKDNLRSYLDKKPRPQGVVGIQIAKGADQDDAEKDFRVLIQHVGPLADYIVINISCPNTPGLTDLQKRGPLLKLLSAVKEERARACGSHPPPLVVKIAPDMDMAGQEYMAETLIQAAPDGVIMSNTRTERFDYLPSEFASRPGGLSGKPIKNLSTEMIGNFYKLTKGKIPIIGVGGISSGRDAYEKIKAGASLVQLYTGLVYKGPGLINAINRDLLKFMKSDGLTHISQAVGRG